MSTEKGALTQKRVTSERRFPAEKRVPAEKVEWTIMIFMVGDNNLSEKCEVDLREIKKAGSSKDVTVIVQTDLSPAGGATTRYLITPDGPNSRLEDDIDGLWPETRPEVLRDFLHWCIKYHPAKRYMLLLWGHARGLDAFAVEPDERLSRRAKLRSTDRGREKPFFIICPDNQAGHAITNKELQSTLESVAAKIEGGKIHVLGMVACLMGMFEMCYELRRAVHYMIASESLIPDTSLPFDKVIPFLIQNPKVSEEEVCRTVVQEFKKYYVQNDELPVQLSAFDLTKADQLRTRIDELGHLLLTKINEGDKDSMNALLGSHFQTQRYDEDQFFDLYDFCYMLKENCRDEAICNSCDCIMGLIGDKEHPNFVVASEFNGDALQFSYGLAIYFPWVRVNDARYRSLDFAHAAPDMAEPRPTWLDFLNTYVDSISKIDRGSRDEAEHQSAAGA